MIYINDWDINIATSLHLDKLDTTMVGISGGDIHSLSDPTNLGTIKTIFGKIQLQESTKVIESTTEHATCERLMVVDTVRYYKHHQGFNLIRPLLRGHV